MGRVLSRLTGVLSRNIVVFGLLSLLLVGVPTAGLGLLSLLRSTTTLADPAFTMADVFSPMNIAIGFGSLLVTVAANTVLQGAIIHGTVSDLAGERASFGDCISTGVRFILPLVGIGIVSGIAVGLASILLIVPGVLLALAWSVAAPAQVVERTGVFAAFDRSVVLTRDNRLPIFGLAVVYFILQMIVSFIFSAALQGAAGSVMIDPAARNFSSIIIASTLTNVVLQTISSLVSSAGIASIYFELRYIKDGVGADQMAAVFD
jgi:hypothetical protein